LELLLLTCQDTVLNSNGFFQFFEFTLLKFKGMLQGFIMGLNLRKFPLIFRQLFLEFIDGVL